MAHTASEVVPVVGCGLSVSLFVHSWLSALVGQSVECSLRGTGGQVFDLGLRHIKVVKNGTCCSSLGTSDFPVRARTGRLSVRIL